MKARSLNNIKKKERTSFYILMTTHDLLSPPMTSKLPPYGH